MCRINFQPIFDKRDWKLFSDWFGLIHNGSDTDFGKVQIGPEWISIRQGWSWNIERVWDLGTLEVDNVDMLCAGEHHHTANVA